MYRLIASKDGPTKLFVGGLHGKEGIYTAPILETLATEAIHSGVAIIVPRLVENSKYIGVLSEEYYKSEAGMCLIQLIKNNKPSFYFELHAYGEKSYSKLTDPEREEKIGVPPFVDLGKGILIGSIAPLLRRKFTKNDFCVTLEIPNWKSDKVREVVLQLLRLALSKATSEDIMLMLRMWYPAQIKKAEVLFRQYYRKRLKPF